LRGDGARVREYIASTAVVLELASKVSRYAPKRQSKEVGLERKPRKPSGDPCLDSAELGVAMYYRPMTKAARRSTEGRVVQS
jgi:hypothetical protein